MKRIAGYVRILIWSLTVSAVLSGCMTFDRGVGETVVPERRLLLEDGGSHTGAWVTRDLVFSYEYIRQSGRMTLNGSVEFLGSVGNFPVMQSFYIQAYYLNAAGQVIAVDRIYNGGRGKEIGTWRFTRNLSIPPETAGWALGYAGTAKDYGTPPDAVDWTFWDTPFK